jgi:hypothetical protein
VILAAALLVLVALGLFIGGIATGATALYWACVAVSAIAAVLLVVARRQLGRPAGAAPAAPERSVTRAGEPVVPAAYRGGRPERAPEAEQPFPTRDATSGTAAVPDPSGNRDGSVAGTGSAMGEVPAQPVADSTTPGGPESVPVGAPTPVAADLPADDDPPIEEVEVTDLLLIVDLHDDVFVVDEHPRYHLADCRFLRGRTAIPLPMDEARTDGFTPCARCSPDQHMAGLERARRAGRGAS